MKKVRIKSAVPVYLAAAVWLLAGIIRPVMMLKIGTLVLTALLSAATFAVGSMIFKGKVVEVREKVDTGDEQINRQIAESEKILDRMAGYRTEVRDASVGELLSKMQVNGEAVLGALKKDPSRYDMVRRFMNYYLPTVDKVMADYVTLIKAPVKGENILSAIASVEENLGMIAEAFERQLDSLYRDKSMDLDAELSVLETILKGEGLAGERDFAENEEESQKIQLGL